MRRCVQVVHVPDQTTRLQLSTTLALINSQCQCLNPFIALAALKLSSFDILIRSLATVSVCQITTYYPCCLTALRAS